MFASEDQRQAAARSLLGRYLSQVVNSQTGAEHSGILPSPALSFDLGLRVRLIAHLELEIISGIIIITMLAYSISSSALDAPDLPA